MTYISNIGIKDGPNLDSFSRVRVSTTKGLFDSQLTYDLQPLVFEQITTGAGSSIAHSATNRSALMTFASTATGGVCKMQTYEHFRYSAGRSQLVFITFNMKGGLANTIKFAGYSDGTEGLEFRLNGTTPELCILSTTDEGNKIVSQSNWNLDKLDGTGPSGLTVDFTKVQILVIDFQALYVGRVRMGFDIGGNIVYCHEFLNANTTVSSYIKTANLPISCGMTCTNTVSTTMDFICCTVMSEGASDFTEGYDFQAVGTATAASAAATHILSVQPKTTFNSIVNRIKFQLESLNILVVGSNPIRWDLCIGAELTGTTTFNDVNTTYSGFQFNTAGTLSGSPLITIASGYVGASNQVKGEVSGVVPFKYPITLNSAGAVRTLGRLTLLVTGIGGTSETRAVLNWKEIR